MAGHKRKPDPGSWGFHHEMCIRDRLGACAYAKAEERKIRLLQSAGYNAVRISHYPPSLAMLKICDRLGMLLLDECFDAVSYTHLDVYKRQPQFLYNCSHAFIRTC